MKSVDWNKVLDEAREAAQQAGTEFRAKYGEPMYCGFAWVRITPATQPIVKVLKQRKDIQHHKGYPSGYDVWNPGGSGTQSMDIKEHEAYAFAKVLSKYNVKCYANSRAD